MNMIYHHRRQSKYQLINRMSKLKDINIYFEQDYIKLFKLKIIYNLHSLITFLKTAVEQLINRMSKPNSIFTYFEQDYFNYIS